MTKKFRFILVSLPVVLGLSAFAIIGSSCAAALNAPNASPKEQAILSRTIELLGIEHYSPVDINNDFSHKVFDMFLERSDYNKKILLQSDVDELKKHYDKIDDQSKAGSLDFFDKTVEILNKRIAEDRTYYTEILSKPFDFTVKESVELDPEKLAYAKNKTEMREAWRKFLKYQVLVRFVDLKEEQDKKLETKKEDFVVKSDAELESEAREKVKKTEDEIFDRLAKVDRADRMASFVNVLTGVYDPHTEFYPPNDKEDFDIRMSGQLEGIGATLQEKDGYIKVISIMPGSPSSKQGQLKAGDLILKVAQGDKDPVDIVGMQVGDAVKLIRGKKGTEVRLTVKKPDGQTTVISIIRDIVVLEETFAQSAVIEQNGKVGYIKLPSFYADFTKGKTAARYAADDVKREIEKLKAENIDGLILDLRDNGGGSLQEVVKMVGLFIKEGPVVQVSSRRNGARPYVDPDRGNIVYEGPLVVMINENSASASEILAAAIQDYKRGVIVGSNSFGKGTVQNFYDLDQVNSDGKRFDDPLGAVKVTIQKFYRIDGSSTQLKGVSPDISLPGIYSLIETGEKDLDNPLAWDQIRKEDYTLWSNAPKFSALNDMSRKRVAENKGFQIISSKAEQLKREKDMTLESLLLTDYMAQRKKLEEENKALKALEEPIAGMKPIGLKTDMEMIAGDTSRTARKTDWLEKLGKDVYLSEAAHIVHDMKGN
ncbi:MAG: carboxy terminal-processing peptidase [Bacteroidetes bacterium]|nr:carboxy terminal-processing peptidase [Bacteroidota bacterium]